MQETHPSTDKLLAARNWCLVEERPPPLPVDAGAARHGHAHHLHDRFAGAAAGRPTPPTPGTGGAVPALAGGAHAGAESPAASPRAPRSVFAGPEGGPADSHRPRRWGPGGGSGLTDREAGSLNFVLRVERPENQEAPPMCYSVIVPTMVHSSSGEAPLPSVHPRLGTLPRPKNKKNPQKENWDQKEETKQISMNLGSIPSTVSICTIQTPRLLETMAYVVQIGEHV
jgi:hypothetical protein